MTRSISQIIPGTATVEGEGVLVHRPFPSPALSVFDPFLLIDEMGPIDVAPNAAKGFPDHPHRGFETVTYLLSGRFEHRDSRGNAGKIEAGDVQWMTAGSGLVHSEAPETEFRKTGGHLHGFQVWLNLPKRDKMIEPRYQEVPKASIPEAHSADGKVHVRVIAGEALGAKAVIDTRIPIQYLHFTLAPGASIEQPVPAKANALAYVFKGTALFGGKRIDPHTMVAFGHNADSVQLEAAPDSPEPVELLLLSGEPINEPVARYGPFVMNTREELEQAFEDYQSGRMGVITR
ncbi:MAG: pirin family protein [Bryobacteraceae bacterium]